MKVNDRVTLQHYRNPNITKEATVCMVNKDSVQLKTDKETVVIDLQTGRQINGPIDGWGQEVWRLSSRLDL